MKYILFLLLGIPAISKSQTTAIDLHTEENQMILKSAKVFADKHFQKYDLKVEDRNIGLIVEDTTRTRNPELDLKKKYTDLAYKAYINIYLPLENSYPFAEKHSISFVASGPLYSQPFDFSLLDITTKDFDRNDIPYWQLWHNAMMFKERQIPSFIDMNFKDGNTIFNSHSDLSNTAIDSLAKKAYDSIYRHCIEDKEYLNSRRITFLLKDAGDKNKPLTIVYRVSDLKKQGEN